MNFFLVIASLVLAGLSVAMAVSASDGGAGATLAHDVYFTLNDSSPEAQEALVDACERYLKGHDGTVFFAAGKRATEKTRDVNDTGFDVSLHVYFQDEASHEAYQNHPRHHEFIEKMKANWKTVRVFDSWVKTGR